VPCLGFLRRRQTWAKHAKISTLRFTEVVRPEMLTLSSAQCPIPLVDERSLNELPELSFLPCTRLPPRLRTEMSHSLGFLTFFFLCPRMPTITKSVVPGISSTS
jgi:hypothetical protein